MYSVHVSGMSLWGAYSISHVLRNVVLGLHEAGMQVTWENPGEERAEFPSYRGRTEFLRGKPAGKHVRVSWLLPVDGKRHPDCVAQYHWDCADSWRCYNPEIIKAYNDMPPQDRVLLFSQSCRTRFEEQGLDPARISVVPLGIDPLIFKPEGDAEWPAVTWLGKHADRRGRGPRQAATLEGKHTFLTAGYLQARKGVLETVEAYCRAFSGRDDVALVIKQVRRAHGIDQRRLIQEVLARHPDHPPVAQCSAILSDWRWAALLRAADTVVNAHRIEGFGMVPLEAMACGTAVITTRYAGVLEYATPDNCLLLEPTGEVSEVPDWGTRQRHTKPPQCLTADYDIDDLSGLLVGALDYEPPAGLAAEVRREWSWEATARRLVREVEGHTGGVRRAVYRRRGDQRLSVLIGCRNAEDDLLQCVSSLRGATPEGAEILVFDDASKRAIAAIEGAQVYRSEKWVGLGVSRVRNLERATGEWLLYCDADIDFSTLPADWLDTLIDFYRQHDACAVTVRLLRPDGTIDSCGGLLNPEKLRPGKHLHGGLAGDDPAAQVAQELCYASGAFLFCRREDLEKSPPCDKYFPIWFEDVDPCYHLRLTTGRGIWYCPELEVIHRAHSWIAGPECRPQYFTENESLFMARWGDMVNEDILRWLPGVDPRHARRADDSRPRRTLRAVVSKDSVA